LRGNGRFSDDPSPRRVTVAGGKAEGIGPPPLQQRRHEGASRANPMGDTSFAMNEKLCTIYSLLDAHFGDLHWWPARTPFEVIVGAVLTQNTAWRNVEIALDALRKADLLHPEALSALPEASLAPLLRPAGYYNVKARRLKAFIGFLFERYRGDLEAMLAGDMWPLRKELLAINGIGEETADTILLYAAGKPIFVIDAYTRRILQRHGLCGPAETYGALQAIFMSSLPPDAALFNQYHALLVNTGKSFCKKRPYCDTCPLNLLQR
jgi:endonuclease III related protein